MFLRALGPLVFLFALAGCAAAPEPAPTRGEIAFEKLADGVWMHVSHKTLEPWGPVRSNGLIVVTDHGAVLIDTGWDDAQTQTVLDWAAEELGAPITSAVFTHAHDDKMGGVGAVIASGAATYAHPLSNRFAPAQRLTPAEFDLAISEDGDAAPKPDRPVSELSPLEVFYPGPGHTPDNLVVGLPEAGIVFGGCLIRPGGSTNLGNTATANIAEWSASTARVAARFPDAEIIVPSHGPPAGRALFAETMALAEAAVEN